MGPAFSCFFGGGGEKYRHVFFTAFALRSLLHVIFLGRGSRPWWKDLGGQAPGLQVGCGGGHTSPLQASRPLCLFPAWGGQYQENG